MFNGRIGPTTRWRQPDAQLGTPAFGCTGLFPQIDVVMQVAPHRVEAAQGLADAVMNLLALALFHKSAKHAIPEDENAAVVFVNAVVVLAVVHTVVRRGHKHPVKPTQAPDQLGVHPVLVEQIDQTHGDENDRRYARYRHGQVENPTKQPARRRLPQSGGEVVVLR